MPSNPGDFGPRILVLGRANRHRSPMLAAMLREAQSKRGVLSAGVEPAERVDPKAVQVMREIGFELEDHRPQPISTALNDHLALIVYVSPAVEEEGPIIATPGERLVVDVVHPRQLMGGVEEPLDAYRQVRDALREEHLPRVLDVLEQDVPG